MVRKLLAWTWIVWLPACGSADKPFDYCGSKPPDAACYAEKRDPGSDQVSLAMAIADKQLELHPADTLAWDWEEAVMLVGLDELYRVTGRAAYLDYLQAYCDHHIAQGYEMISSDTAAPAQAALAVYRETGEEKYRLVVEDALHYLYEEALRTEQGGINHLGTSDLLGITLWVDSLFMFGNLLTHWGELEDDQPALDEFVFQFDLFSELMQEEPGWFKHAWGWSGPQDDDVYWARGNAWVTAAGYEHLRARQVRGERIESIEASLARQVQAIMASQAESGLWWNIPNRPGEIYEETSASALFAYALARAWRYGLAGDEVLPVIARAMAAVEDRIETDEQGRPVVTGVSGPTTAGTFDMYALVPLEDDLGYGLGAVILALVETAGLPLPEPWPGAALAVDLHAQIDDGGAFDLLASRICHALVQLLDAGGRGAGQQVDLRRFFHVIDALGAPLVGIVGPADMKTIAVV